MVPTRPTFKRLHAAAALTSTAFLFASVSFVCATQLYAQSMELRDVQRQVDRVEERLKGAQNIHQNDVAAIRQSLEQHAQAISQRLSTIERYLFWLFTVTGGVGTVVGGDIGFRVRKKVAG